MLERQIIVEVFTQTLPPALQSVAHGYTPVNVPVVLAASVVAV